MAVRQFQIMIFSAERSSLRPSPSCILPRKTGEDEDEDEDEEED
jgi:hypothetical protein